ncbi:MAG: glycosyltransferase [Cyanobacteria bacterium CRU_2_1]|nr:glycosyltransferase [Cyanobacteria bacterium CRU_2_1]
MADVVSITGWMGICVGVRSLSALFGVASIPAAFGLGHFAFRSLVVGQIAAALMAVSPFGIYLAQEARHYTLPILWIIASLTCLIAAARTIRDRTPLAFGICIAWVLVNVLGIATHYFVILTLMAEAIVITAIGLIQSWQEQGRWYPSSHWWRLWAVAGGTIAGGVSWLPFLPDLQGSPLTQWIQRDGRSGLEWLDPIAHIIASCVSMIYLLPIQAVSQGVAIASGIVLIFLILWTIPKLIWGWSVQCQNRDRRLSIMVLSSVVLSAICLFVVSTYVLDRDLTIAFRYHFVYFPAVIILIGAALASSWEKIPKPSNSASSSARLSWLYTGGKKTVLAIGLLSLIGGLTVISNLGYQKTHRPDVVVQAIQQEAAENLAQGLEENILVAIAHQTHGQTGRLMGIAWQMRHDQTHSSTDLVPNPQFLLVHLSEHPQSPIKTLRRSLNRAPRPLALWLVNFQDAPDDSLDMLLNRQKCSPETHPESVDGYRYRLYRCK